jgi:putative mRNA 3-end processing factor
MPVHLQRGVLTLSGSPLTLDARRSMPVGYISHAHSDHLARHEHLIATPATVALAQARVGAAKVTTSLEFGTPYSLGNFGLQLFPAGHVLGAAQLRVQRDDGHVIVYTGDFSVRPSLTASQATYLPADTLLMEATFGDPRYRFPPKPKTFAAVADWARDCFRRGRQPVVLTYSLGKSQETIAQLARQGFGACVDSEIERLSAVYRQFGVDVSPRIFDGTFLPNEVGVFPPHRAPTVSGIRLETAALTGWALEPWGARRAGADVAFPISDHADFDELMAYGCQSGAREILTVYGHAATLAKHLRQAGLFARSINERVQMHLPLG